VGSGGSGFIVLLLADPHQLGGGQGGQDGASDPGRVLALRWGNDLDFHCAGCQGWDLLPHPVSNARVHCGTTDSTVLAYRSLRDRDFLPFSWSQKAQTRRFLKNACFRIQLPRELHSCCPTNAFYKGESQVYRGEKEEGNFSKEMSLPHPFSSQIMLCIYGRFFQPDHQTLKPAVSDNVTEAKKLFSTSAFSTSRITRSPASFRRGPTFSLVCLLSLTYR